MSVDAHIAAYDPDKIPQRALDKLRAEIEKGTLDPAHEPIRFGNTKGLSILEN